MSRSRPVTMIWIPPLALVLALASDSSAPRRPSLWIDRKALRRALSGRDELVEVMAEVKAAGMPGVNVGVVWKFFTTSVYQSGDLPVIATREALQNSVDAIRAAVKARQISDGDGFFRVTWDPVARSITWEDNGIGMDAETILSKFLSLGETGKGEAQSSGEAAGGFGVAKAVILGLSETFRWKMHTQDNLAVSEGHGQEVVIYEAPWRQGTSITIFDVSPKHDSVWDYGRQRYIQLMERLAVALGVNDLPKIRMSLDGYPVKPLFSRRGGSSIPSSGDWGSGTAAWIKVYRRPPGDRHGAYYVRLGGLYQFTSPARRGALPVDVVVDLSTTVRPGQEGYPLNAARDNLMKPALWTLSDLKDTVEKESESVGASKDDIVFDPDSDSWEEVEGAEDLALMSLGVLQDERFLDSLKRGADGVLDFYRHVGRSVTGPPATSAAPAGSRGRLDGPTRTMPSNDVLSFVGDLGETSVRPDRGRVLTVGVVSAARSLKSMIEELEGVRVASSGGYSDSLLSLGASRALDVLGRGQVPEPEDLADLERTVVRASEVSLGLGGGGIMVAGTLDKVAREVMTSLLPPQRRSGAKNPFGRFAALRISRVNYDAKRSYRFRKNYQRWFPHLVVWDTVLRMVTLEGRIRRSFRPGFLLDDKVAGMASTSGKFSAVYINPERFAQVVQAHRERPIAIAVYVHGIAVHELTHLDGRMGDGHGEEFVSAREDLGAATAHLLPTIAILVENIFRLKLPETAEQKRIRELEREIARLKTKREGYGRAGWPPSEGEATLVAELAWLRRSPESRAWA